MATTALSCCVTRRSTMLRDSLRTESASVSGRRRMQGMPSCQEGLHYMGIHAMLRTSLPVTFEHTTVWMLIRGAENPDVVHSSYCDQISFDRKDERLHSVRWHEGIRDSMRRFRRKAPNANLRLSSYSGLLGECPLGKSKSSVSIGSKICANSCL